MLETQKKAELNGLQAMGTMANASMGGAIFNFLKQGGMNIDQNKFMQMQSGMQFNTAGMTDDDRAVYGAFQNAQTQMKANNELLMTQMKQQIEEKYENLNDALLEPLKWKKIHFKQKKTHSNLKSKSHNKITKLARKWNHQMRKTWLQTTQDKVKNNKRYHQSGLAEFSASLSVLNY